MRLLGQLPWHSRYQLALADADEYQAEILAHEEQSGQNQPETSGSGRPNLRRWSPDDELQAILVDGFNTLITAQSGKKKKVKPTPRPETGRERAKRARDSATMNELFDTFSPGR